MERNIVVIAHNLRSCHNVGSLLRTAEGLGIDTVFLTGYTPYPKTSEDTRLPHIISKISKQINKTSLGAEYSIKWEHENINSLLKKLVLEKYKICALEQTKKSISLNNFIPPKKLAIIMGSEVEGLQSDILNQAEYFIQIPMLGKKESFNVVQAAAMALYHTRFYKEDLQIF